MSFDVLQSTDEFKKFAEPFPPASWKYILKLLGLVVVADKKVLEEEIVSFLKSVTELRAIVDPTISLTERMLRDWFWLNKSALEEIVDSPYQDTGLCKIIAPIKSIPHKLDVISHMVKIAVSDGEYCDAEKNLIKKTCLFWDVRYNFQHGLEYILTPDNRPAEDRISSIIENFGTHSPAQSTRQIDFSDLDQIKDMRLLTSQSKAFRERSAAARIRARRARLEAHALRQSAENMRQSASQMIHL